MKMGNKSLLATLEEAEVSLNYQILSLDLNETNNQTLRQALESSRQGIKEQKQALLAHSTMMKQQEGSKSVEAQWNRLDNLDRRVSKLEDIHESDL